VRLQDAALAAEILSKVVQAIAVGVGGWWAFTISDRTYFRRLQPALDASVGQKQGQKYLLATISVKNPGLRNVEITQVGSALLVLRSKAPVAVSAVTDAQWEVEGAFDGLKRKSIEPGVTVVEERFIPLPAGLNDTLQLRLRLVAHGRSYSTTKVVVMSPSQE
jgi:hypothetical protein